MVGGHVGVEVEERQQGHVELWVVNLVVAEVEVVEGEHSFY